ncbi:MAG TPA: hypothetical protein V6C71_25465 [Coleofasciculaceae cyanobacterium]|jgi:hypothetical protein
MVNRCLNLRCGVKRHHRSERFFHDPTHVRPITSVGLSRFSKRLNLEWQTQGRAFT